MTQAFGPHAGGRPDIVIDASVTARLGKGWVGYVRPWFRQASTAPHAVAKEIYQAAAQHQHVGRVSTRLELGYVLSPIGIGMMDMRPDTNPVTMTHLSYVIPMLAFDKGAPPSLPIASSYPLGSVFTASASHWDARVGLIASPPNRGYVLNSTSANPRRRPFGVVGGGLTPRTGVRIGAAYARGEYASVGEFTTATAGGRSLRMMSVEGELAFGYTKLTGEVTRDSIDLSSGHTHATQWFIQGVQTLAPRWFVGARHEGANAPPSLFAGPHPTLRVSEVAVGYRLSMDLIVKNALTARKTYYSPATDHQYGVSLVWAKRWR